MGNEKNKSRYQKPCRFIITNSIFGLRLRYIECNQDFQKSPRLSLRYLINANKNRTSKEFIVEYLDIVDGENHLKVAREDLDYLGKSLNMKNVINIKK